EWLVWFGLLVGLGGLIFRFAALRRLALPRDQSMVKGNPGTGILYAFTWGMMPWAKESTRIHIVAYTRGILFHLGIFTTLGVLMITPIRSHLPGWLNIPIMVILGVGSLLGMAGGIMRWVDKNLKTLSTPDDHFSVWLISVWMMAGAVV